ncbi:MAG TPA: hypothetical protein PKZ08_05490 [Vicinamibacterales bacterium]|nr:hypothetical protein [Vicinamibacterales bacterium]
MDERLGHRRWIVMAAFASGAALLVLAALAFAGVLAFRDPARLVAGAAFAAAGVGDLLAGFVLLRSHAG